MSDIKIGIMGGTFDPVHNGHLMAAEAARDEFKLDKIWFIPTGMPPHKRNKITDSFQRIRMLELALESNPHFQLNTMEIERQGTTYTYDTMCTLNMQYPTGYSWYYIIGSDTLMELDTWRNIDELYALCQFIVYERPGISRDDYLYKAKLLADRFNLVIKHAEGSVIDISSTDIRDRIRSGKSVRYLLPDKVIEYIENNHIYSEV